MPIPDIEKLKDEIRKYNKKFDSALIEKAFLIATNSHEGQTRKSGEDFFSHPYHVAMILTELGMDDTTIAAALLHDVLEDTNYSNDTMKKEFGEEVAKLVEGVTKLEKIQFTNKEEEQVENLRKMFIAMAEDIRVIIIKLADRLHNMRTIQWMEPEKRREKALETMQIYAPLAHRLGIYSLKWQLEDLSLMQLDPVGYREISSSIDQRREERVNYINAIIETFKIRLKDMGIHAAIEGRAKHFYSIYTKMYAQNKTIDEIYDLFAIRVIVDTVAECYTVLGLAHELFKPMPGRFKDYISMPKKNMYQSLHSTLIGTKGTPFEIQIRTKDMHKTAEYGVASHWKYKEGTTDNKHDKKIAWIRQLLEFESDSNDAGEFIRNLKTDLFSDEVFVFTPKGDVISLPAQSNAIDFAFMIHTAVGCKTVGAKVNGKIVTLDHTLNNGDIVEILTNPSSVGPSLDWIKIAKTSQARSKINQWFKKEHRNINLEKGKEMLEKEMKKLDFTMKDFNQPDCLKFVFKKFSFHSIDDFYASIGYGGISIDKVILRVKSYIRTISGDDDIILNIIKPPSKNSLQTGITVKGIDNCLIKFAKCCNPLPGDDVVGYITRGRGVSVHREDCASLKNLENHDKNYDRMIEVEWTDTEIASYMIDLLVTCNDRSGLLADITVNLNDLKVPVRALSARTTKDSLGFINITLEVKSTDQLVKIINKLKTIKDVINVTRKKTG